MSKAIKITDIAYDQLKRNLTENTKFQNMNLETIASNLITTFLNAKIKWDKEKGEDIFQLYDRPYFIDLKVYLKDARDIMPEPLIESLLEIADSTTWKKFAEILEEHEHQRRKP